MVFSKKIIRSEQLADKIPVILCLLGLILFSIFDWIGVAVWVVCVMLFCLILYNINLLFPLFLFLVGLTAQLSPEYHHLFSYGLTGVMILNWLFFKIYTKESLTTINRSVLYLIIFYIGWNFISALFSEYTFHGVFIIIRIMTFFVIVLIYYDWLRNLKRINTVINTIIYIGVFSASFVILEFLQSGVIFNESGPVRYSGIFTGVNALGFVLAISISFSLLNTIIYFPKKKGIFFLLIFIFTGFALFLTFSRSAWLLFVVSAIIITYYHKSTRPIIIISFIIIGMMFFSENFRELIAFFLRLERSISYRDIIWQAAVDIIKDHPLVGVGPDSIREYIVHYSGINPNTWLGGIIKFAKNNAHNFYLTMGAELGVVGILIAVSTIILFNIHFFKTLSVYKVGNNKSLIITIGAIVMGLVVRSFFEGNGFLTNGWLSFDLYFWLLFIIILRIREVQKYPHLHSILES